MCVCVDRLFNGGAGGSGTPSGDTVVTSSEMQQLRDQIAQVARLSCACSMQLCALLPPCACLEGSSALHLCSFEACLLSLLPLTLILILCVEGGQLMSLVQKQQEEISGLKAAAGQATRAMVKQR